MEQINQRA